MHAKGVEKRPEINDKEGATNYYIRRAGQFVYGRQNLHKGAFGVIPPELDGYQSSSDIPSFDVDEKCLPEWIDLFLKQGGYYSELSRLASGVGSQRISPTKFLNLEMPLPSVNDQKKILEWVNFYESTQQRLKSELSHQQTLLKKLRQQILQEAIEGKLTADWRAQNPDVETASELLKRIAAEKAQLVKEKKIKEQKPLPPIKDEEKPFELPQGWAWCNYGDAILEIDAGLSPVCFNYPANIDEWGVLKISAISWDSFQENENKKLHPNTHPIIKNEVKSGDFIMTRANTKELVAKSVIVGNVRSKLLLNDKTLRVRFSEYVDIFFMNYFNNSEYSRLHYIRVSVGASPSMKNISRDNIKTLLLPLPSLPEQQAIVAKVEKLHAICDQLEARITQNQTYAEQLMQAVLKEAFSQ